ncbi:MAG: hypothetical protein AAFN63_10795 [Pseudomonadota bacterium]
MTKAISDETLTAFLDGALGPKEQAEFETALADSPDLQDRLARLDAPLAPLRQGFDALLDQSPAMPSHLHAAKPEGMAWRQLAAVLVLGVGLGAGAIWMHDRNAAPDWKLAVAQYQVLYVPQTLAIPAPDDATRQQQLSVVSDAIGVDLSPAGVASGLNFRRAQQLGFEGAPLIQIAYLSEDNQPFAFCVTEVDAADSAPSATVLAGLAGAHWVEDGKGYLIIGGDDLGRVTALAGELRSQL